MNNFPVPVLAETSSLSGSPFNSETTGEARESTIIANETDDSLRKQQTVGGISIIDPNTSKPRIDSRGGENFNTFRNSDAGELQTPFCVLGH